MNKIKILLMLSLVILFFVACDVVESVTTPKSDAFMELYGDNPYDIYDGTANGCDGNTDGKISQGESVRIQVRVTNTGTEEAKGVKLTVTTEDEYVTVAGGETQTIGDAKVYYYYTSPAANSTGSILLTVAQGTPNGHIAELILTFEDENGYDWVDRLSIIIEPISASVVLYGTNPYDIYDGTANGCSGNENGNIEAGETARLKLRVKNDGNADAMMVTMLAQCNDSYVTIVEDSTFTFGDIHSYFTISTPEANTNYALMISADAATPSGHAATISMTFTDKFLNQWTDSFSVIIQ